MTSPAPRRSDPTRAAILAAARDRFATQGYERATIRAIAADAGIDPAMVMRYYGNKEGLFAAAATFDLQLPDLATGAASQAGGGDPDSARPDSAQPDGAKPDSAGPHSASPDSASPHSASPDSASSDSDAAHGQALVRHFVRRWESDGTFQALLRAAVTNDSARQRMLDVFSAQLAPRVAAICPEPTEALERAGLIASQMLGIALCRYVLRVPPMVTMPADALAAWVGPTLERYLTAPIPGRSRTQDRAPVIPSG
jgi:AcrR family transcriptional regulator